MTFCYALRHDRCVTLKILLKHGLFFVALHKTRFKKKIKRVRLPITVHILGVSALAFSSLGPAKIPVYAGVQVQTGLLNLPGLFTEIKVSLRVNHSGRTGT